MSVNSSTSSNDSIRHPNVTFNPLLPSYVYCLMSRPASFILSTCTLTYIILLLPLCIFIIHHGLQQWRQKRSTSSAATMSHSDCFTYNMVIIDLIGVFGCILCCCGIYSDHLILLVVGFFLFSFTWYGEMFFHILTCVERYLAVVHPITYLSLRKERGIRIRNISIGCVWLLCFADTCLVMINDISMALNLCHLTLSFTITSFCSLSVLCVLIRPGPGDLGGGRERVDQTKQRAFYTIMAIMGVLILKFSWNIIWCVLYIIEGSLTCMIMACGFWINLPSSLVLPLLFLHRAEKFVCWKKNTK